MIMSSALPQRGDHGLQVMITAILGEGRGVGILGEGRDVQRRLAARLWHAAPRHSMLVSGDIHPQ
jgi:hypothetical protein